jgi:hypothetical protein
MCWDYQNQNEPRTDKTGKGWNFPIQGRHVEQVFFWDDSQTRRAAYGARNETWMPSQDGVRRGGLVLGYFPVFPPGRPRRSDRFGVRIEPALITAILHAIALTR